MTAAATGAGTTPRLLHGDVQVGDELPYLRYDVTSTTVVLGALATRDWRPQHHDYHFATERNGVRDIFLNTPNQAAWLERYVTDWTGPHGRLGKLQFRMADSVFPGEQMLLTGSVTEVDLDDTGCGWIGIRISITQSGRLCTTASARVAVPLHADDNPWRRSGDAWCP
jgi:acyl dehydratase